MFEHGEIVIRLRPALVRDPYSDTDELADWADDDNPPAAAPIPGCGVAGAGSIEPLQDGRNAVVSDFDVILPPGTDLRSTDRLVVRGLTCAIQGRPFDWLNPFTGWRPGMVARAKIVEG